MAKDNPFDFDDGLDDIDFGGDSFSDDVKDDRNPASKILNSTSQAFSNQFNPSAVMNDIDEISKNVTFGLGGDKRKIESITSDVLGLSREAGKAIKKEGKRVYNMAEAYIPDDGFFGKIKETLGEYFEERDYGSQTGPDRDEKAADAVIAALGAKSEKSKEEKLRDKRTEIVSLNSNKLLGEISATLSYQRDYVDTIETNYYRESLKLQFKQFYLQEEMFNLAKADTEATRNQLEAIVKNTALPEIQKLKVVESFKKNIMQGVTGGLSDRLINRTNWVNNLKAGLTEKLAVATELIDQAEMATGMMSPDMGLSPYDMIADSLAGGTKRYLGEKAGNTIGKTKTGKKLLSGMNSLMSNPADFFKDAADKTQGGRSGFFRFLGDVFNTSATTNYTGLTIDRRDTAAVFDSEAHTALVRVIPDSLSKIIDTIRETGGLTPTNEYFDYDSNSWKSRKTALQEFKTVVNKSLDSNMTDKRIYDLIKKMESTTGIELSVPAKSALSSALIRFAAKGNTTEPKYLAKRGFYQLVDVRHEKEISTMIDKFVEDEETRTDNNLYFNNALESIGSGLKSPNGLINKMIMDGNAESLIKDGIISFKNGRYALNDDKYAEMLNSRIQTTKGYRNGKYDESDINKIYKENNSAFVDRIDGYMARFMPGRVKSLFKKVGDTAKKLSTMERDELMNHLDNFATNINNFITDADGSRTEREKKLKSIAKKAISQYKTMLKDAGIEEDEIGFNKDTILKSAMIGGEALKEAIKRENDKLKARINKEIDTEGTTLNKANKKYQSAKSTVKDAYNSETAEKFKDVGRNAWASDTLKSVRNGKMSRAMKNSRYAKVMKGLYEEYGIEEKFGKLKSTISNTEAAKKISGYINELGENALANPAVIDVLKSIDDSDLAKKILKTVKDPEIRKSIETFLAVDTEIVAEETHTKDGLDTVLKDLKSGKTKPIDLVKRVFKSGKEKLGMDAMSKIQSGLIQIRKEQQAFLKVLDGDKNPYDTVETYSTRIKNKIEELFKFVEKGLQDGEFDTKTADAIKRTIYLTAVSAESTFSKEITLRDKDGNEIETIDSLAKLNTTIDEKVGKTVKESLDGRSDKAMIEFASSNNEVLSKLAAAIDSIDTDKKVKTRKGSWLDRIKRTEEEDDKTSTKSKKGMRVGKTSVAANLGVIGAVMMGAGLLSSANAGDLGDTIEKVGGEFSKAFKKTKLHDDIVGKDGEGGAWKEMKTWAGDKGMQLLREQGPAAFGAYVLYKGVTMLPGMIFRGVGSSMKWLWKNKSFGRSISKAITDPLLDLGKNLFNPKRLWEVFKKGFGYLGEAVTWAGTGIMAAIRTGGSNIWDRFTGKNQKGGKKGIWNTVKRLATSKWGKRAGLAAGAYGLYKMFDTDANANEVDYSVFDGPGSIDDYENKTNEKLTSNTGMDLNLEEPDDPLISDDIKTAGILGATAMVPIAKRLGAKTLAKRVPIVGTGIYATEAYDDYKKGNYLSAGLSALEAGLVNIPFIGGLSTLGIDVTREYFGTKKIESLVKNDSAKLKEQANTAKTIKKKNLGKGSLPKPKVGNKVGKISYITKALLSAIMAQEGTNIRGCSKNPYSCTFSYHKYDPVFPADLTSMTISAVLDFQEGMLKKQADAGIPKGKQSSAIGAYQFLRKTLAEVADNFNIINRNTIFSPYVQDIIAEYYLKHNVKYNEWLDGKITDLEFLHRLSAKWASIPDPKKGGRSYHNQPVGNMKQSEWLGMLGNLRHMDRNKTADVIDSEDYTGTNDPTSGIPEESYKPKSDSKKSKTVNKIIQLLQKEHLIPGGVSVNRSSPTTKVDYDTLNKVNDKAYSTMTQAPKTFQGMGKFAKLGVKVNNISEIPKSTRMINKIVVHCSATEAGKPYTVQLADRDHKARGWSGIGYHFGIYPDGSIYYGRNINNVGAPVEHHNLNSIGIYYAGGLKNGKDIVDGDTKQQREAIVKLSHYLAKLHGVSMGDIWGHKEFPGVHKSCPNLTMDDIRGGRLNELKFHKIEDQTTTPEDNKNKPVNNIGKTIRKASVATVIGAAMTTSQLAAGQPMTSKTPITPKVVQEQKVSQQPVINVPEPKVIVTRDGEDILGKFDDLTKAVSRQSDNTDILKALTTLNNNLVSMVKAMSDSKSTVNVVDMEEIPGIDNKRTKVPKD